MLEINPEKVRQVIIEARMFDRLIPEPETPVMMTTDTGIKSRGQKSEVKGQKSVSYNV